MITRRALVAGLTALAFLGAAGATPKPVAAAVATPFTVPNYRGALPVLCYHGVYSGSRPAGDVYSVSQAEFSRQMAMLAQDGFHAITIAQYARFAAGDTAALPDRPILITFDDGRLDSFTGADPVLARYGMRATMFVITANATAAKPGYLGWAKLRGMAAGGRWDLQLHAHTGHVRIPTGPGRRTGPFYANLAYRNGARETFTAFKRRVTTDILAGRGIMAAQIPGFQAVAFAVPYGDYGQQSTNYGPIPAWELGWLERSFKAVFVQDRRLYNMPGSVTGQRFGVRGATTAAMLHQWLGQALPRSAWVPGPGPPLLVAPQSRPRRPALRRLRIGRHSVTIVLRPRTDATLRVTRRRAGHAGAVHLRVGTTGRMRDRLVRSGTRYVYRVIAVDAAGQRSRTLMLRLRTH